MALAGAAVLCCPNGGPLLAPPLLTLPEFIEMFFTWLWFWLATWAAIAGFGSLIFNCSLKIIQNSPIFWMSPILLQYSVRQFRQYEAYPFVSRILSPGCIYWPGSSHTDKLTHPVWSATLHDLTSRCSLVVVGFPTSNTIKFIVKFFRPARRSFTYTPCTWSISKSPIYMVRSEVDQVFRVW